MLLTSFFMSNPLYCPLIWMFCSKSGNKEINRTNKHALRVLYEDYDSSFEQLLEGDGSITVDQRNLQNLMTEIYKTINQINPAYMWEFFVERLCLTISVLRYYVGFYKHKQIDMD